MNVYLTVFAARLIDNSTGKYLSKLEEKRVMRLFLTEILVLTCNRNASFALMGSDFGIVWIAALL
jgi:hypothetical protein